MSYSTTISKKSSGEVLWEDNITFNVSRMAQAIPVLKKETLYSVLFSGAKHSVEEVKLAIAEAVAYINKYPQQLLPLEPWNGWGKLADFRVFLEKAKSSVKKVIKNNNPEDLQYIVYK